MDRKTNKDRLAYCFHPSVHDPLSSLQYEKVTKLTSDAKFETSDVKASVAAIAFILSSAAKHSVDGSSLDNELQQLGLPKGKTKLAPHLLYYFIIQLLYTTCPFQRNHTDVHFKNV